MQFNEFLIEPIQQLSGRWRCKIRRVDRKQVFVNQKGAAAPFHLTPEAASEREALAMAADAIRFGELK